MYAGEVMKEKFENCLFRYRKLNGADREKNIDALKNNRLYFSTPVNFNDPYDNRMYVDKDKIEFVIREDWKHMDEFLSNMEKYNYLYAQYGKMLSYSKKNTQLKNEFLKMIRNTIDTIKDNYRNYMKIICFSEEYNSELMWSHYAENHKGFLIAYDRNDIEKSIVYDKNDKKVERKLKLASVQYTNIQVDMTSYIHDFMLKHILPTCFDVSNIPEIPNKALLNMATTKSESWKYEKEWRLMPRIIDIVQENPMIYVKIKPKAIIAGTECIEKNKKELNNIANIHRIPFYEMKISSDIQYKLVVK